MHYCIMKITNGEYTEIIDIYQDIIAIEFRSYKITGG